MYRSWNYAVPHRSGRRSGKLVFVHQTAAFTPDRLHRRERVRVFLFGKAQFSDSFSAG